MTDQSTPLGGRSDYSQRELNAGDLHADPLTQFQRWVDAAIAAELPEPLAAALATADAHGTPSVRMILVRGIAADGLRFYTNHESRKGKDLADNPQAALTLWWPGIERQVRCSGPVRQLTEAESAAYFTSRPRESQLGARASRQGQPTPSRGALEAALAAETAAHPGSTPIELPEYWGGYLLTPDRWEFWQGRQNRLHDRFEYLLNGAAWEIRRLQP
ncbi:MAG: pyridoxamine 5'-phosphate oxidase [Chloroflexi bacterium]|nr:pyridoxamine 5'-phosphate oxidase [Chloroflexota bacterium]